MSYVEWEFKGREFSACNCDYGCPCQFNALPTTGDCMAVCVYQIEVGHFGATRLDGLAAVLVVKWPGPIHDGDGQMQVVIDARADAEQREALRKITHGEETEPGMTVFSIFHSTMSEVFDPVYRDIEVEIDVEARQARLVVPGMIEAKGEPIRNPVTGEEHRARIDLPNGFDFTLGEVGSGSTNVRGAIEMDISERFGLFAEVHSSTHGVVR